MKNDNPGLPIPPPLIYLAGIIVGYILRAIAPLPIFPGASTGLIGLVVILIGLVPGGLAVRQMHHAGTTPNPMEPSTTIVTGGPFRYTRNPIYLSFSIIMAGFGIAANSWWFLPLLIAAIYLTQTQVIQREEKYLEGKFGDEYLRYKASVRRWL